MPKDSKELQYINEFIGDYCVLHSTPEVLKIHINHTAQKMTATVSSKAMT